MWGKSIASATRRGGWGRVVYYYFFKTNLGRKKVKFARLNFDDGFMALMMLRCYWRSQAIMISFCLRVNNDIFQNDEERCNVFSLQRCNEIRYGKCWDECSIAVRSVSYFNLFLTTLLRILMSQVSASQEYFYNRIIS